MMHVFQEYWQFFTGLYGAGCFLFGFWYGQTH